MKYLARIVSVLFGGYSFAFGQTGAGAPGGSPGTSAGQTERQMGRPALTPERVPPPACRAQLEIT
jgi:hypothetical protein